MISETPLYHIERLSNIKRLNVTAWYKNNTKNTPNIVCNTNSVTFGNDDLRVLLDCHVDVTRMQSSVSDISSNSVHITLPITLDMKRDCDLDLPSANELKKHTSLHCRSCHIELVSIGNELQMLPMPSEHWTELSELWVCDPHTLQRVHQPYGLPDRPIDDKAQRGRILVGTSLLIVPIELTNDTIVCSVANSTKAFCCVCNTLIGESIPNGFRVYKRCILSGSELLSNSPLNFVFRFYTAVTSASQRLLDLCLARKCYRVSITCCDDENKALYVLVSNWSSFVKTPTFPVNEKRMAPVIKVMYSLHDAMLFGDASFDMLEVDEDEWNAVRDVLSASTLQYPPTIRTRVKGVSEGFLPRLSRIV